jgi:membrane protein DedA with SNARE-associated domain
MTAGALAKGRPSLLGRMERVVVTLLEAIGSLDPQILKAYVMHHKDMAGPILGIMAFGESLVLIGLFFPATFIMVFAGLAIQQGQIDGGTVVGWSIAGAVVGDAVTYWIGRWIGPSIVHHRLLRREKTAVAKARLFFRKYGFLAIFIGRFLGPVRPTIPLVGGIMRMGHMPFQAANAASAIMWVPFMLFWGYLFSKLAGDLSTLTMGHWIALAALILALIAGAGIGAARVQGKDGGKRKAELLRRKEWRANNLTLAAASVGADSLQDHERLADRYEGAWTPSSQAGNP